MDKEQLEAHNILGFRFRDFMNEYEEKLDKEYKTTSPLDKRNAKQLFEDYQTVYNRYCGVMALDWDKLPNGNKLVWIGTIQRFQAWP